MKTVLFCLAILVILNCVVSQHDDTDPADGHSGMSLYIDARTGCQYVAAPFGALTPRLDRTGKQICSNAAP
jgi:hypothetical protein